MAISAHRKEKKAISLKLGCFINVGLAATAVGLAVLGWLHLLNPYFILLSMFCIGGGFAFNAPAWTSIVPQVVSDEELPSATTLSGLQFSISGIIGPALGGILIPLVGAGGWRIDRTLKPIHRLFGSSGNLWRIGLLPVLQMGCGRSALTKRQSEHVSP